MEHQYISRDTGAVVTETFIADRTIRLLYNHLREQTPLLFRAMTGKRFSGLLGSLHYDLNRSPRGARGITLFQRMGIDWHDCLHPVDTFVSPRQVFERQICYWDCRPMEPMPDTVASPADARMVFGDLSATPALFVKGKFFSTTELLGADSPWSEAFACGSYALFRLTPDKYHYNHAPVSGEVVDVYVVDGQYHSCNPQAVIAMASLHSKNRRVVTVIDTDVAGGTGIGLVAMIEVVALMIGDIVQCYSVKRYESPVSVNKGLHLQKGCPKSLYRPGSSTDILLFQKDAVSFSADLMRNAARIDVRSRFSAGLGRPLVETDVQVRSTIAKKRTRSPTHLTAYLPTFVKRNPHE